MTTAIVPARGGSQELKRKNLLPVEGLPAFLHTARAAALAGCDVIVSTDDPEIASIATANGYTLHARGPELAKRPVDEVVLAACVAKGVTENVLLVQPTVQPIDADTLARFVSDAQQYGAPTAAGVRDRHLMWHAGNTLTPRVERQTTADWPSRELGIRWWPTVPLEKPSRIVNLSSRLVDIDTAADYQALTSGKTVQIRFTANTHNGSGHLRRAMLLAQHLQHHEVVLEPTLDCEMWAIKQAKEAGWTLGSVEAPDVLIVDTLDTDDLIVADPTYLAAGARLHLEDSGPGRRYADATVNALYDTPGAYCGADWADIRAEFLHTPYLVRETGGQVMLMFGGTDPSGLGERVAGVLERVCDVDWVKPQDGRMVSLAMQNADLLITSAGRTVFEAAAVGVPSLVLAQNMRETTHTHLGRGNAYLGLGRMVSDGQILHAALAVLNDYELRREMSETGKRSVDGKGVQRIVGLVDWLAVNGRLPERAS